MRKKYQVFVSSTYNDLIEERKIIKKALLEKGCIPVGMEEFPAADLNVMDYIKEQLDNSDYCILILGGSLGSIDKSTGKSFTLLEYEYAIEKGIPILTIVKKKDNKPFCAEKGVRARQYRTFVDYAADGKLCKFYSKRSELSGIVHMGMDKQIELYPRKGWMRMEIDDFIAADDMLLRGRIDKLYCFDESIYSYKNEKIDVGNVNGKHIELYYGAGTQQTFRLVVVCEGHEIANDFYNNIDSEYFCEDVLVSDVKMQVSIAKLGNFDENFLFFSVGDSAASMYTDIYRIGPYALEKIGRIHGQTYMLTDSTIEVPIGSQGIFEEYIFLRGKIYSISEVG